MLRSRVAPGFLGVEVPGSTRAGCFRWLRSPEPPATDLSPARPRRARRLLLARVAMDDRDLILPRLLLLRTSATLPASYAGFASEPRLLGRVGADRAHADRVRRS